MVMAVFGFFASARSLSDCNVALLGDSMTWIGGDSCDVERGWSCHFKRMASPKSISVFARSGATWTNTTSTKIDAEAFSDVLDDDNVVYNQVVRLCRAAASGEAPVPDVIVVYAGANDAWFASRRNGIFDETAEAVVSAPPFDMSVPPSEVVSLAGSVRLSCDMLSRNFPTARIVLVTPTEMVQAPLERVRRVSDIIEGVAKGLHAEVIRADKEVEIRRDVEGAGRHRYTSDGIHTNPAGARLLGGFLAERLGAIVAAIPPVR